MKRIKMFFAGIFLLSSVITFGQTASNRNKIDQILDYINREFATYNKVEAHFRVEDEKLVFANKFGVARIPFQKIDFRINDKTNSIDIFCVANDKCIYKYDDDGKLTTWDYYNVSMPDGDGMASSKHTVLSKCKELKNLVLGVNNDVSGDMNSLLQYVNSEISRYNKYSAALNVQGTNLIFTNEFGRASIPFQHIDFRMNTKHNSIDIYCLDGSKCIEKYDDKGALTTWDYYNISMPDGSGMAASGNTVLQKCKAIKSLALNGDNNNYDDNSDHDNSVSGLLRYINGEFDKYNKFESHFVVQGKNLVFTNEFGKASIPFSSIDFRMNYKHNSIDIYCINGDKCIEKYDDNGELTTWDYYNVSLPNGDRMAASANNVLAKCSSLKKVVMGQFNKTDEVNPVKPKRDNTGSTEDY